MAHIESMSSVHVIKSKDSELRLSKAPLQDPAAILLQMPTQAISPALLELLDLLSSPILLLNERPAGELREMMLSDAPLAKAA